ncbi:MAG TPA: sulfur carrier protein ThiS [Xanthomonadales bacterium]|nr:sulfur carrier protein ThiS [Xanthomonadales bacterium]
MDIMLNGKPHTVDDSITVEQLLESLLPPGRRVAVEVNEVIVPRTLHQQRSLSPGDRVEVVQAIGGG